MSENQAPKIDLRIPKTANDAVKDHAASLQVLPSDIVRDALEFYFEHKVNKPVSFQVRKRGGDYRSDKARTRAAS